MAVVAVVYGNRCILCDEHFQSTGSASVSSICDVCVTKRAQKDDLKLYEVHVFWPNTKYQPSYMVLVLEADKQADRAGRIALEKLGISPDDAGPPPQVGVMEMKDFKRGDVLSVVDL